MIGGGGSQLLEFVFLKEYVMIVYAIQSKGEIL